MGRRTVRIALFAFALLATAGLGYRAMADEARLAAARQDGAATDQAAEEAFGALLDVRGSMYAYVAPNQGTEFWAHRVGTLLDTLRQRLVTLDTAAAASGGSLSDSLDGVDQLAAADKRARQYVERGELLLAGDVLFTEVRDLLNAVTEQVTAVRSTLRTNADRRTAGIRQEQAALAAAGVAAWFLVALLLLPGRTPAAKEPLEWRHDLADTLKKVPPGEDLNLKTDEPLEGSASAPKGSGELRRDLAGLSTGASAKVEAASGREGGPDLKLVAEICADLSTLTDIGALSGALARAGDVIGAKGLIVWVTSNDGASLSAVASHGFDARVVARVGAIDRASDNLTAAALRANAPRLSVAHGSAAAAIAVPMCGPTGPVGVLSAELQPGKAADDACVAVASIFAAQLATLTAPLPMAAAPVADAPPAKSAAS
ncbi:MAG: hypothetical protein WC815_09700 [Vicinamibacterales bacterium]|jgi:hypothetical protein